MREISCAMEILIHGDTVHGQETLRCAYTRWPGVLQDLLGPDHVVEEGNNGGPRSGKTRDGGKDGLAYLDPLPASHYPLDLVIIMLGTNAAKGRFSYNAWDIAKGVGPWSSM